LSMEYGGKCSLRRYGLIGSDRRIASLEGDLMRLRESFPSILPNFASGKKENISQLRSMKDILSGSRGVKKTYHKAAEE